MTSAETMLWKALRNRQLAGLHFRRQQVIRGFIADFYCHAAALVVEVDGPVHDTHQEEDAVRDEALTEIGLQVLHVSNDAVEGHIEYVLDLIARAAGVERPGT